MKYTIVIKQEIKEEKEEKTEYQKIGSREVARAAEFVTEGNPAETRIEDVYGYPPARREIVASEMVILKQEVEDLDIKAVIKAVNGI